MQSVHRLCFRFASIRQVKRWNSVASRSNIVVLGQPSAAEHPHLVKENELTPGFTANEYIQRRKNLVDMLPEHSCAVIAGHPLQIMSADIPYRFRQNSDFSYLCGFQEPDAVLILRSRERAAPYTLTLIVPPKDLHKEMWDGPRAGVAAAQQVFGADRALSNSELRKALQEELHDAKFVYYDSSLAVHPSFHTTIMSIIGTRRVEGLQRHMHQLRVVKSLAEVKMMKRAASASSRAFQECMQRTRPGMNENELDAICEYSVRMAGCTRLAYPPVVASGNRCNTLHYIANNQIIRDGDLVLMDAGAELYDYVADITRTWPANGKFTPAQADVYNAVLSAQVDLIERCRVDDGLSLDQLHRVALVLLGRQLQKLGILPENCKDHDLMRYTAVWYPHHTSHWLGMDVHDTMQISRSKPLLPGNVVTVEPGLYFNETDYRVPERYRGIGIRIEDDVLITEGAPDVLTAECPKTISEIESITNLS